MLLSRINDSRQNFAQFPIKLFHIHGLPNETILSIVWQSVLKANICISAGPLCKLNVTITKPPMQQNAQLQNPQCSKTPNYKTPNAAKNAQLQNAQCCKSPHFMRKKTVTLEFFSRIFATFLQKFLKVCFLECHVSMAIYIYSQFCFPGIHQKQQLRIKKYS